VENDAAECTEGLTAIAAWEIGITAGGGAAVPAQEERQLAVD
jgi:hypothetical protein